MKCRITKSARWLCGCWGLCLATTAAADSITFSATTATAPFISGFPIGGDFSESVALPRFDPAWGTLENIDLRLDAVGTAAGWRLSVYNPSLFPVSVLSVVSGDFRLLRPDNSELIFMGHASPFTDLGSLSPLSASSFVVPVPDSTVSVTLTNAEDFSLFTGTDAIALPIGGFAYPYVFPNTLAIVATEAQSGFGRVTITYDFVPIPEPGSLAVLALRSPLGRGGITGAGRHLELESPAAEVGVIGLRVNGANGQVFRRETP